MPLAVYDGINLNIDIPSTGSPVITMDALVDFYEPWKDFLRQGASAGNMVNKKFPQAWRPVAGDPITSTVKYTGMIFLQNQKGWRIRLPDEDVTLIITGLLALEDLTLDFHRARTGRTGSILGLAEFVGGVVNIGEQVWDTPLRQVSGTFGEWVQKKLLTVSKFLGLK